MNGLESVALKNLPHWFGEAVFVGSEDKTGHISIKPGTLKTQCSNGYCVIHYHDSVDAVHPSMIFMLDYRTVYAVADYNLRIVG